MNNRWRLWRFVRDDDDEEAETDWATLEDSVPSTEECSPQTEVDTNEDDANSTIR